MDRRLDAIFLADVVVHDVDTRFYAAVEPVFSNPVFRNLRHLLGDVSPRFR
jgi:hypothetical protein